jgi:hypothetical protein
MEKENNEKINKKHTVQAKIPQSSPEYYWWSSARNIQVEVLELARSQSIIDH